MITLLSVIVVAVVLLCACLPYWHVQGLAHDRAKAAQASRDAERRRLALELSPSYQQAQAQAQAHTLALAKLQIEREKLAQEWAKIHHQQWLATNIIAPDSYRVIEGTVQAFPSLKALAEKKEDVELAPLYPQAPAFATIQHLIRPGRLILGYSVDGPIHGDVTDLLSMAFVGKPGTGKSSALLYYLAMMLLIDATVYVFDPQGSLNEVADFLPYYGDFAEIGRALPAIYQEIEEREDLWRNGRQVKGPMLILVDELPAIARWEQKAKPDYSLLELSEKVVLENRKHNVYCLLTGQSLPAEVLPTLTRDNLSSRLVFNSSNMHARMAGLDDESRKRLLPLLRKAQPGTAILDVSRRAAPDIAALPFTSVEDVRSIVESSGKSEEAFNELQSDFHEVSELSEKRENMARESHLRVVSGNLARDVKADVKSDESIPEVSSEDEEQIMQIARTQLATYGRVIRSKIPAAMSPARNNSMYPAVKYICNREGW